MQLILRALLLRIGEGVMRFRTVGLLLGSLTVITTVVALHMMTSAVRASRIFWGEGFSMMFMMDVVVV